LALLAKANAQGVLTMTKTLLFESATCGRCGGSGSYSWCQMYGSRCFKCAGAGVTLTKRGAAAQAHFTELCSSRIEDLKVGDTIRCEAYYPAGMVRYWGRVTELALTPDVNGHLRVTTTNDKRGQMSHHVFAGTKFRVAQSAEAKQAKTAEALAYQATLTKTGTVRKVKKGA
jgi:hypothetical protein